MATRYWVGGSGSWSNTARWSTTSGGAGGASVPTSVDDVIFDANSGAGTSTVDTAQSVNSITITPASATAYVWQIALAAQLTTNNLTTTGTTGITRIWFRGATYGIAQNLAVNGTVSISDCDFRDVYVIGTAAPISGTRIGNLRGCRGITFSTPKTSYWVGLSGGNWASTSWAATSGGGTSANNFPLAQDTAIIENTGLNIGATVTLNGVFPVCTLDASTRTNAATISTSGTNIIYGDLITGSGITYSGVAITFSGRNTQTITSAGKNFGGTLFVDSYGGTVKLADALNIGANTLTVTNGTFDTQGYSVTALALSSSNSNVRTISLGASTLVLSGTTNVINFSNTVNLTFNAGTSTISLTGPTGVGFTGGGQTFYNVAFDGTTVAANNITGANTFNNLTLAPPATQGVTQYTFAANQTINGALTCSGANSTQRIFVRSSVLGTQRDLTVATLFADDCDFRDIDILGAASGSSPTRAGDCGNNLGITFPSPKTVYWNLSGTQNWSATAWASSSGGTPSTDNFPLAQDTAVFNNAGSVGTVTINAAWNIGTFDASARTTSMTLAASNSTSVYGDWRFGTGVTVTSSAIDITFSKPGTQTITSNGRTFGFNIQCQNPVGNVQLADALTLAANRNITIGNGTFDAVTYNVTASTVSVGGVATRTLKMGSGTWTLSGTANVWTIDPTGNFYKGTANIVLSDTSSTGRTFSGAGLSYNKLTIGGATGTSTLTISGNNQFTELASTKTVAHTIALGTTAQTFGKWTVTGTVGNVVTLTGTGASHSLAGACTSGIDYLAMGSIGFSPSSPGEFYAGANSTGTAAAPVYRTAKPADSTRYWVGGTGNWSDTARWSASSGGASGASVPRSHDDVVFNSASNATSYTATVNAVSGGIRMKSLTISGPASGNVTLAGSTDIVGIHGNITFPATGMVRTFTGGIALSGSSTGNTFTSNGVAVASVINVNGVGCEWSLGSALSNSAGSISVGNGSFSLATYNLTAVSITSSNNNSRTINFGTGTVTLSGSTPIVFGASETIRANLTVTASTSEIICSAAAPGFDGNNQTFYNVSFTSTSAGTVLINGANTFNNLSFTGITSAGLKNISVTANQTINGTLTLSAGTDATMRHFVQSDTLGTTRTLTCAAFSGTDADFRDITIAGAAAPVSGTRLGDCKGNSGITFPAPKTVWWRSSGTANWNNTASWSFTDGGTADVTAFPLAQDTAVIGATYPTSGNTVSLNASYNVGTIDMSARTSNTMTLSTSANTPTIYGNWINGTGTTLSGTGVMTFAGRGSQTITSAGVTFTQGFTINTPGGSVVFQDAFTVNVTSTFTHTAGTLDGNGYNVTLSNSSNSFSTSGTAARTLAIGSGTWTFAGTGGAAFNASTSTNLTVTGTGTISLTAASAKTFQGGGISYSGITLDQGGAGTLTITGNNTFKDITNTYSATGATTINMGTTTQTVEQWTARGESGRVLTVTGTNASTPATLILTGNTDPDVDYLSITGVRAYSLTDTWYAGVNSTNNGSLGWYFQAAGGAIDVSVVETASGTDVVQVAVVFNSAASESATGADSVLSRVVFKGNINETGTASDLIEAIRIYVAQILESASGLDSVSAVQRFASTFSDTVSGTDSVSAKYTAQASVSETASFADVVNGGLFFLSQIEETATAADVLAAFRSYFAAITEGASIADAVAVAASTFNATAADTATGTDAVLARATFPSSTADTATGSDTIAPSLVISPVILESGTGADSFDATQTFSTQILEAGAGTDTIAVAPSVFNAPVVEISTIADASIVAPSVFNAPVVETVVLSDAVIGAFLWNLIDDAQTPDWQNISTTQSVTWTLVDDSQNPNWQNINTLN